MESSTAAEGRRTYKCTQVGHRVLPESHDHFGQLGDFKRSPIERSQLPIQRFGSRSTFAFEIGDNYESHSDLRTVDVYSDGRWLTCDDNVVYIPQFLNALTCDLDRLVFPPDPKRDTPPKPDLSPKDNHKYLKELAREDYTLHMHYRFMDWGPTADNVSMHFFRENGKIHLPFSFWRHSHHAQDEIGTVFCTTVPESELRLTFHQVAWRLMWDWSSLKRNREGEPSYGPKSRVGR